MIAHVSKSTMISRPLQVCGSGVALSLSFRVFQFFPGMGQLQEAWFILVALALVVVYLPWRWRNGGKPTGFETYLVLLTVIIPIWSSLVANRTFGQPVMFGLLAERGMVLIAGIPLLTHQALATRTLTLKDLERALVGMAWLTLILYIFMHLALDAGSYFAKYGLAFVSGSGPEAMFKFNVIFIVFGFYYYGFKGIRNRTAKPYFQCIVFFLFLLIAMKGRSLLLVLIAVFLLLGAAWTQNRRRLLEFVLKSSLVIAILWIVLYFLNNEFYNLLISKFSDAFTVLFTGELTGDASANARITESMLAMPYILENFFTGNGMISSQWNGGFESAISGYFFPDDIGILGVIFLYGLLGTVFYLYQFKFAISFSKPRQQNSSKHQSMSDASKGIIIFFAIRSLATAQFVYTPEPLIFFIGILWALTQGESPVTKNPSGQAKTIVNPAIFTPQ